MMKKFLLVGITFLFLPIVFGQVNFQDLSLEEAIEKAKKENKLVFVDVYAEWCGPCKMLDRDVFPDKDLGKKLNKSFISIKVDGDEEINWGLKESFGISAYPTMLMIHPTSAENRKIEGYRQAEDLILEVGYALNPSTSPAKVAESNYNENPTRENYRMWIEEISSDNGTSVDELYEAMDLFVVKYPELDLDDDIEMAVFLSTTKSLENPNMLRFIEKIESFDAEVAHYAFMQLVRSSFTKAKDEDNISIVQDMIKKAFPVFEPYLSEDMSQDELLELVKETFEGE
jgi:thiol-disulfide isomerase/thioredoxin